MSYTLVPSTDSHPSTRITSEQQVSLSGTHTAVVVPPGYSNFYIDCSALSAATAFAVKVDLGNGTRDIKYDLDSTAYPRSGFTGTEVLSFVGYPPTGYSVNASADSGVTGTLDIGAWD